MNSQGPASDSLLEMAWVNGEFMAPAAAKVSALDRGFIFGDAVYEVVPAYGGNLFLLQSHLQRLARSLEITRIRNPYSDEQWGELLDGLVNRCGNHDQSVYLQVTRGVAPRDHAFPDVEPTVFCLSRPLAETSNQQLDQGLVAITTADIRWDYCHAKTTSLIANVMLRQQAVDAGADEALLLRDGLLTEGSASNAFVVVRGELLTPTAGEQLLHGITRERILQLARQQNIPVAERSVSEQQLRRADEICISSSTKGILPVTRLDDVAVGEGTPGPVWHAIWQAYQAEIAQLRKGAAG
ncbi:MAG: D-amino acid aminotransferase [Immundisolibacteraceae bacterium]|nr:D-amino acid aminotransferase [Immundisolibacteraceae bacterium]